MRMIRVPAAWFDWLTVPRSLAIVGGIGGGYALLLWFAYRHGDSLAGVLAAKLAPLVAFAIAAPLIALFCGYIGWIDERTLGPWQGRYYAFDGHQVRVHEARGTLWFPHADVCAALGVKPRAHRLRSLRAAERLDGDRLGCALSLAGLVAVFGSSTDRTTLRFLNWAERDVERPWRNQRERVAGVDASGPSNPRSVAAEARAGQPRA